MWYYDSQIISRPKTMVISNITYPKAIFRNSSQLTELGIKPYREIRQDSRYFWDGAYSVDTSGDEVVGTYAGTARDVATLKAGMLSKTNSHVASLHAAIDWYWSRAAKGGTSVPSNIATYASALYSEHETKKTEIAALNNIAKIKEYENRAYTETRKLEVYDADNNMTYHASDTRTIAREINMCTHFSDNPNTPTDAGLVSLTAD